jgi:hypothetical protein
MGWTNDAVEMLISEYSEKESLWDLTNSFEK